MNEPSYALNGTSIALKGVLHKAFIQPYRKWRNSKKSVRHLEIGPGDYRVSGHETLNVRWSSDTDYIASADKLPFEDRTFDSIYASHVLEHFAWYKTHEVLCEWRRVLKLGGKLTIFVPDALRIAKAFVSDVTYGTNSRATDGWYRLNPNKDAATWFCGRMFSYGDGHTGRDHPNWHKAAFTYASLALALEDAGFSILATDPKPLGMDHGWINLGFVAERDKL